MIPTFFGRGFYYLSAIDIHFRATPSWPYAKVVVVGSWAVEPFIIELSWRGRVFAAVAIQGRAAWSEHAVGYFQDLVRGAVGAD